jgi:hypothetical protein
MKYLFVTALSVVFLSTGTVAQANPLEKLFGFKKKAPVAESAEALPAADAAKTPAASKTPRGWSKGGKKGWKGKSLPPGLAKRNHLPPGHAKGDKFGSDKHKKAKKKPKDKKN